jgi:hypothetical protein
VRIDFCCRRYRESGQLASVKEDMVDQFESDQKALDYVVEPAREQEKSYPSRGLRHCCAASLEL